MYQIFRVPAGAPGDGGDTGDEARDASASQAKLVWRSFRRHRLAMGSGVVLVLLFLTTIFTELIAPYHPTDRVEDLRTGAPPQLVRFVQHTDDGGWRIGPYVYGYTDTQDEESLRITYEVDKSQTIPLGLFVKGDEYELFGLIPWDRHLIGATDPDQTVFLLGANETGRDVLSRMVYATRISISVGLVGVFLAFLLGVTLGGISGYFGGKTDTFVQRLVEFAMSIPQLPLWLALSAAIPITVGAVQRYFYITSILAILAWTTLARELRGRFLALRTEDFVTSAWLDGSSRKRVMFRHMLPSTTSHLIANLTLSIPVVILAETALSFLRVGLIPPAVSWGTLLLEAQDTSAIQSTPWLLLPGLLVVVTVLALNFVGDGLRDAADPYRQ